MVELDIVAIRNALEFHMARTGMTGRELSRAAGLNETAVRDLMGKVEDPRFGTLLRLAHALKVSPATLFGGTVEIAGNINEHGEILPIHHDGGPPETVARPPEVVGDVLAYCVKTSDLMPAYGEGDILYIGRENESTPDQFIGRECALQVAATSALLLRTVEPGTSPGRFNLSLFRLEQPLVDVQLAWAAPVVFVMRKPVNGHPGTKPKI